MHHFEVLVNLVAAPEAQPALIRLIDFLAANADELWLTNEWRTQDAQDAFSRHMGTAVVESAETAEFPASALEHFGELALQSRHAEIVARGEVVLTSDDFGETVHVRLVDHLALKALLL